MPVQQSRSHLVAGAEVMVRGRAWTVDRVEPFDDCDALHLRSASERAVLLYPFDRPSPRRLPGRARWVAPRTGRRRLCAALADATSWNGLRTAARLPVAPFPHQLDPVLAVLNGAARVLLADDVGLGKTVEASLILSELVARGEAARTLILTPAGLRDQWQHELRASARLRADVLDVCALRQRLRDLPPGVNPWTLPGLSIVSFDLIKRPELLRAIEAVVWDLLIVDEAHNVAGNSERHDAVAHIARSSRRVVLITATPHSGDARAFNALCSLGAIDDAPLHAFRRMRRDVGWPAGRRARTIRVRSGNAEREAYALLARYVRAVLHECGTKKSPSPHLAMEVLVKRAGSSAHALAASVTRRLAHLECALPGPSQLRLPLNEDEDARDQDGDEALAVPGLGDVDAEREWLQRLLRSAQAAGQGDAKLQLLRRLITRTREPVLIFTEYRDTLSALTDAIGPLCSWTTLHGGMARGERLRSVAAFTGGAVRVLLATDAGGEGLNLHHTCRYVVSVDLPWSPARLEQRIGRVDRLGQKRTVHALHLVRAAADARVLSRLQARIEVIQQALNAAVSPRDRRETEPARKPAIVWSAAVDEARCREVVSGARSLARKAGDEKHAGSAGDAIWITRLRASAASMLLLRCTARSDTHLVAISIGAIALPGSLPAETVIALGGALSTADVDTDPRASAAVNAVREAVDRWRAACCSRAGRWLDVRAGAAVRERRIAAAVARMQRAGLQPGLFERRDDPPADVAAPAVDAPRTVTRSEPSGITGHVALVAILLGRESR
jgi:ERCC4-related helicase